MYAYFTEELRNKFFSLSASNMKYRLLIYITHLKRLDSYSAFVCPRTKRGKKLLFFNKKPKLA